MASSLPGVAKNVRMLWCTAAFTKSMVCVGDEADVTRPIRCRSLKGEVIPVYEKAQDMGWGGLGGERRGGVGSA